MGFTDLLLKIFIVVVCFIAASFIVHTGLNTYYKMNIMQLEAEQKINKIMLDDFNNSVSKVQNIANAELTEVQNKGYLDEATKFKIQSEVEDIGVKCKISGTPTKVKKGNNVFLGIEVYSGNSYDNSDYKKSILVTRSAN